MPTVEEEQAGIPEWVVTFGDMMSLLLTFFIMLASLSEIKAEQRYQAMAESIRRRFGHETAILSMIGVMGEAQLNHFFRTEPQRILFRGHSHDPEIAFLQDRQIIFRALQPGRRYQITDRLPCVVTCGALTGRFCMIWMPSAGTIECHRFDVS